MSKFFVAFSLVMSALYNFDKIQQNYFQSYI